MMTEPLEEQTTTAETEPVTETDAAACEGGQVHRARGLLAIGLFKLSKALFFSCVGFGALHLIHSNLGEVLLKTTNFLHIDPDAHFVDVLQDKADLISGHQLRQLSMATFGYAMLSLIEGVGLMLEKTWAEYLTLTLTICALPWEVYELIKHGTVMRLGLLLVNLAVLAYLIWFIKRHRKTMHTITEANSAG